jgi:H+/gluconate symporter-like permease
MIFLGAAIAGLSSGEMLLFGLVIAFMLILVGGLFWMEFGKARELEERLKQ